MTPLTQAKILRVLQDQRFERVGGSATIQTDVRIIAATNRPLVRMIAEERFRNDLYYRLSGFTIELPALRERRDDIPLLVNYFLKRFAVELGKPVAQVTAEAMSILQNYDWPGNVRELQSTVKQAMLHATAPMLMMQDLPHALSHAESSPPIRSDGMDALDQFIRDGIGKKEPRLFDRLIAKVKTQLLLRALEHTDGNQVQAAKVLGITRSTLRNEIRNLDITIDRSVSQ
jgi:two-component system nitrogen regulation response regulator GlnG